MTNPPRPRRSATALDYLLAALAHVGVAAAWALTAASMMGLLSIPRRIVMNSEWAFDTGRLPQPWWIAVGVVAILVAHLFFRWAMTRAGRGKPAYGPSVVAWGGALLGVAWGAYNWIPPVTLGRKVGPEHGQATPWNLVGWVAYYGRLWVPAVVGLVTVALLLVSRQSPLRAFLDAVGSARARRRARRGGQAVPVG